jgi:hypothetical protein
MLDRKSDVARILSAIEQGDARAAPEVLPIPARKSDAGMTCLGWEQRI